MSAPEKDFHSQIIDLKAQLQELRLTQRDSSFKFNRELQALSRLITSLSFACSRDNPRLNEGLDDLRQAIEQKRDISELIPRLAVLDRMLKQQTMAMDKHSTNLDHQVRHSGETLLRIPGLPARIKRDLRDILSYSGDASVVKSEPALKLLNIYERSVKIITANPDTAISELNNSADRELLTRLSEELQGLINELDFDGESGDLLSDIRAKLLMGTGTHALLELTLQTLKLVVDGTKFERKTSEKFLTQVNDSLSNTLNSSVKNVEQSESYFEQRQTTNKELSSLLGQSQDKLNNASSLENVKSGLQPLFDQLTQLSERVAHAEEREQALIDRMLHSKNQLQALFEITQDQRRRLEAQSERMLRDPLTGVFNRPAFNDKLEIEYRRWIRNQHSLRLVFLDIDNFKSINDSFGYTAGDKALKIIARTIKNEISEHDTLARFSGEEFILLLPERDDQACFDLVQRVQQQVAKLPFKFRDKQLKITISISSTLFKDSDTPEEVLDRVNRLITQAKKQGPQQLIW